MLRAELDAAFFHLYGIERDDVDYIMETFPIVKKRDVKQFGDYRTKLMILHVYDAMAEAMETGEPYPTMLDPPPADPRVAHPPRDADAMQLDGHPGWHARAAVLADVALTEAEWNQVTGVLAETGEVERKGEKRGTRYRWSEHEELLLF